MSRWKPGDVAMVSALNKTEPYRAYFDGKTWREYGGAMFCVDSPHTIRPLIVIDPEDREQVRELAKSLNAHGLAFCNPGPIAAALRELANPTPPCPAHVNLAGRDYQCVEPSEHGGGHRNPDAQAVWGDGE